MPDMPRLSRRSFVTKASLGAAAVGALAVAGPIVGRSEARDHGDAADLGHGPTPTEPVIAELTDLRSGTVSVYVGERGVTVTDHILAQRLARAIAT